MTVAKAIKVMKFWKYILGAAIVLLMIGLIMYTVLSVTTTEPQIVVLVVSIGTFIIFTVSYFCGVSVAIEAILRNCVKYDIMKLDQELPGDLFKE